MAVISDIYDFLFGERKKDENFKPVEKLEQTDGLIVSNPHSDIKVAEQSNIEVPKFVAPFRGNTGLRKMQNMLSTATVTYIDNIPELTALEKSDEVITPYNPDIEMLRKGVERLREFERQSYVEQDMEKTSQVDEEVEEMNQGKVIRTIRI